MIYPANARTGSREHIITGATAFSTNVVEVYKHRNSIERVKGKLVLADRQTFGSEIISLDWLEGASGVYNISKDPKDYVVADVPIVTVDFPNRNSQAFPFEEVSYFDPMYGSFVYKTFVGKPCNINHDNKVPQKARGVHFHAGMQYVPKWNVWKIRVLTGWDRSKDPTTANEVLKNKSVGYSMGCFVDVFLCSICGATHTNRQPCKCIKMGRGSVVNGKLAYQICIGCCFFETSKVSDPADATAQGDTLGLVLA